MEITQIATIFVIILLSCMIIANIYIFYLKTIKKSAVGGVPTHTLMVDLSNMYFSWYMEKYDKKPNFMNQDSTFESYIRCMDDHYTRFRILNGDDSRIHYVLKNHKVSRHISDRTKNKMSEWVTAHDVRVSIAVDHSKTKQNTKEFHYLKGRDDYLLFHIAKKYKKYSNLIIMSNDKFRDFYDFKKVPEFDALHFGQPKEPEHIDPSKTSLSFRNEFKYTKVNPRFTFKNPSRKITVPMWDFQ
jgi:hypothetical protein